MEDEIEIEEDDSEKKYFTMIPNMIVDQSTSILLALYIHIKKLSGKKNQAFPSRKFLMEKLGVSKPTLLKSIDELIEKGWIAYDGMKRVMTDGGEQGVHKYKITNIWLENIKFYEGEKGVKMSTPLLKGVKNRPKGGKKTASKGVKNSTPNKINHIIIYKDTAQSVAAEPATDPKVKQNDTEEPMERQKFVEWCRASPLRHIQLIAEYADEKKLEFKTKGQWREFIKRNVRPAKQLSLYNDQQIDRAMLEIEKAKQGERGYLSRWTLETLVKYLDQ